VAAKNVTTCHDLSRLCHDLKFTKPNVYKVVTTSRLKYPKAPLPLVPIVAADPASRHPKDRSSKVK